jgi:hypothetical protein
LGQCVLLTSVHKLRMQWPDYLANLLFHSYSFSSNSQPTPRFRPLAQQPGCVACFHPFESSSFKCASSRFIPCPLFAAVAVRLLWLDFIPVASVRRFWIDWLGYSMTHCLWHNFCGRSPYEGHIRNSEFACWNYRKSGYPVATWISDQVHLVSLSTIICNLFWNMEMRHWVIHSRFFDGIFCLLLPGSNSSRTPGPSGYSKSRELIT